MGSFIGIFLKYKRSLSQIISDDPGYRNI